MPFIDASARRSRTGFAWRPDGLAIMDDTIAPSRLPDLFSGVPLVVAGRYRGDRRKRSPDCHGRRQANGRLP